MSCYEQAIYDNKVKIDYLKKLLEVWDWELENGYAKKVLQGQLEGLIEINNNLQRSN